MGKVEDIQKFLHARIGKTENPPDSNRIDCNTWFYGKEVSGDKYPWCVVELVHAFYKTGNQNLIKKTASSTDLYKYYQAKGQIVTKPQPGDICFMYFSKKKRPGVIAEHVGFVDEVNKDGSVMTIEGNTSVSGSQSNGGMICRKKRKSNIVGYARPKYTNSATRATLKLGSKGDDVKYLHLQLRKFGYGVSQYNDKYDELTKSCVTHLQLVHHLETDGICGPMTWSVIDARS